MCYVACTLDDTHTESWCLNLQGRRGFEDNLNWGDNIKLGPGEIKCEHMG